MTSLVRLDLIAQSYDRYIRTGDIEHLDDVERILEYDGTEDRSYDAYDEWKDNVAMGYE